MSYKQMKWMILFIPTITVGLWEYIRHQFLMPYLSMEAGNWLTPVIIYFISVTLLNKLFTIMEKSQAELEREKAAKSALEAREHLARELHDGIAQSLFLLSVQLDKAERKLTGTPNEGELQDVRKTVHEVHHYARQAIAQLRVPHREENHADSPQQLLRQIEDMVADGRYDSRIQWKLSDEALTTKEHVELIACIREAILNIRKHANASTISITGTGNKEHWKVSITDDGIGYTGDPEQRKGRYGLRITRGRAEEMGWRFHFSNMEGGGTCMQIIKGEDAS